jgi:hypothetical protein
MTVKELLQTMPVGERGVMADFLYTRVPSRFIPRDKVAENTPRTLPVPSALLRAHSA